MAKTILITGASSGIGEVTQTILIANFNNLDVVMKKRTALKVILSFVAVLIVFVGIADYRQKGLLSRN